MCGFEKNVQAQTSWFFILTDLSQISWFWSFDYWDFVKWSTREIYFTKILPTFLCVYALVLQYEKSPFCFFCGIAGSRNSDFLLMPGSGGLAGPGCDFIANFF